MEIPERSVLFCVMCGNDFSVEHGEKDDVNRHKDAHSIRDMGMQHNDKEK